MKRYIADDRQIAEQALQWRQLLEAGGAREREAFADWLLESRRHVRNYLLATAFEQALRQIDPQRRHDVTALLVAESEVVALREETLIRKEKENGRNRGRWWMGAAAGMAIAALAASWYFLAPAADAVHATAIGEQQTLKLNDGSRVYLNAQSRLRVNYSEDARHIELLHGEALFVVERDSRRPFTVSAGKAVVQAVGTQFNVKRLAQDTVVSVLEGRVRVADEDTATLDAGEEARIADDGRIARQTTSDIERRVAWRERVLEFRDDPLSEVVAEFNRYNRSPRFRIEDEAIAARNYTGVFKADDPESLAQLLREEKDLVLERGAGEIVIRRR